MKKALISALVLTTVVTSSMTALAVPTDLKEVYNGVDNSVSNLSTTGGLSNEHNTIIITKVNELDGTETDEVVYVDQSASAYSSALKVMFAQELETGYYKATMGTVSNTSNSQTAYFVVGDYNIDPEDKLTVLDEAVAYGTDQGQTWYKKTFTKTISMEEYDELKSIKLISGDLTKCIGAIKLKGSHTSTVGTHGYKWDQTYFTGEGDLTVALQVYAIPEDQTDFNVYFSTEEVVANQ